MNPDIDIEHLKQNLGQMVQMSQVMLAKAEESDWEQLRLIDGQRRQVIMAIFQYPVPEAFAKQVAEAIEEVRSLDQRIIALIENQKRQMRGDLEGLKTASEALRAYSNNIG